MPRSIKTALHETISTAMIHFHTIFLSFTRVLRSRQLEARMRLSGRRQRTWLHVSCVCVCLSISAGLFTGHMKRDLKKMITTLLSLGQERCQCGLSQYGFRYIYIYTASRASKVEDMLSRKLWHALDRSAKSLSHRHYKEAWCHCRLKVQHLAFPEGTMQSH